LLRPRLRADYLPLAMAGDQGPCLLIAGETRSLLIEDPVTADVAARLDGTRQVSELLAPRASRHQPRAVAGALRRLRDLSLLADGPAGVPRAAAAAWDARLTDPRAAQEWLSHGEVVLVDAGSPALSDLARMLTAIGIRVRQVSVADWPAKGDGEGPGEAGASVVVVAPASMTDPSLAAVNTACIRAGRPWTLIRPHGLVLMLGPHLVPGETGCWECLRQRWTENEQLADFIAGLPPARWLERAQSAEPAEPALTPLTAALAGLLAAELPVLAARGRSERVTGRLVALDTRDLTISHHQLVRQPQCPACGDPGLLARTERIVLRPGHDRRDDRDGQAAGRAERTSRRLDHHVSSYLGVISRLAPIPVTSGASEQVTFGYSARHPFTRPASAADLRAQLRGLSGGKGQTDAEARAGAMAEAVERYCGVWRSGRPVRRTSYQRLGPDAAIHLRDILLFSPRQYASRQQLNPGLAHFHRVPEPMADEAIIDWTGGWSLTHDRPRALPAAYCWYGHPDLGRTPICGADSNGCAAGDTLEDAVLHGFCELAERDSVALWWYHRSLLPGVDLGRLSDPWIDRVREMCAARLDRELWVLDITSDLGIPAFAAISRHTRRPTEDIIVGFAADLDPAVAVRRAVSEVCQFLPTVDAFDGARTRYGLTERAAVHWLSTARVAEQPWLLPAPGVPATVIGDRLAPVPQDAAECVRRCLAVAAAAGLEVIVVDQTRPDIELAVARVVVPGLRHFWRRLGPGRLWEVPPRLGRFPLAAAEESANPYSVFF
jgi:bacteriocin biosynthesis cyclodehydratase domain-containing protein